MDNAELTSLTAELAAAFLSNNTVAISDIPAVISSIRNALTGLSVPPAIVVEEKSAPVPAVAVKKSITPGAIISLIDGKPYVSLKRHISANGYTPASYREAFGLKDDYPMVAAEYSAKRRQVALDRGLGKRKAA